jgi:aspartyl aminopeptidase
MQKALSQQANELAKGFLKFNSTCHSPYQAVDTIEKILKEKNFTRLKEEEPFNLSAGGRYYIKRGFDSSMIIFDVPSNIDTKKLSLKLMATHVDSPCLRMAPRSKKTFKSLEQVCIQTYGGGLWHTWFDRSLVLGGRVVVSENGRLVQKIFTSPHPVAKVPNLAIHLQKDRTNFAPNKETHLRPLIAQELEGLFNRNDEIPEHVDKSPVDIKTADENHSLGILRMIARELGCGVKDIVDFDLCFADSTPPSLFGLNQEFISSPRLDNLFSVYFSLMGYLENLESGASEKQTDMNMLMMFDHEEIGSQTYVGADSSYVKTLLQRIVTRMQQIETKDASLDPTVLSQVLARSLLVSADMAHGVHPNYPSYHQCNHQVEVNKGVVFKVNCNGRYITDSVSSSVMKLISARANLPVQEFIVPQDSPCGSTVGPMLSSKLGTLGLDVGIPQLSMHSIRETCGVLDTYYYKEFFRQICCTEMDSVRVGQ